MHPVEEDSRFAIQPVYPDRQALCAEGEEHGKKNNLLLLEQVEKCQWPCRFRPASTIFRKLGPNATKERAGVVLDHPNSPRVTQLRKNSVDYFFIRLGFQTTQVN
jgi:hypothetical protein